MHAQNNNISNNSKQSWWHLKDTGGWPLVFIYMYTYIQLDTHDFTCIKNNGGCWYTCLCGYMHTCMQIHVHVCVEAKDWSKLSLPTHFHCIFLESVSHWTWHSPFLLNWQASELHLLSTGITDVHCCWLLSSGPHDCMGSILLSHSPGPRMSYP